jgi:hypothetical protein
MAVNVKSDYTEVNLVAMKEANKIEYMFIDSQALSGPESTQLQSLIQTYISTAIDEWPTIAGQKDSALPSHELVKELTSSFFCHATTEKDLIIYAQMLSKLNKILDMRRELLHLGRHGVGPITWFVMTIGALITIGKTWFYKTHSPHTQYGLSSAKIAMFGLMIFPIISMDHRILGRLSVDSTPLKETQIDILAWQEHHGGR